MKKSASFLRLFRTLHNDEGGAVMLWVTIMILVVVGLIGLAVDGARLVNLNSNLKEVADAAALAGAKELDGAADSITRARNKAITLLNNKAIAAWSDIDVTGVQIVDTGPDWPIFYSSVNPDIVTTNPKNAAYIKVTTVTRGVTPSFIVAVSGNAVVNNSATAVAKSTYSVCKPMQSFMCNPWESTETNPGNANNWVSNVTVGTMLKLVGGTGGAAGNWGLIKPPGGGPPKNLAPFWAASSTSSCPAVEAGDTGVPVDTGNNGQKAEPGMNVRFDNPIAAGDSSLSAPIVIDGWTASGGDYSCQNNVSATLAGSGLTFSQTDQNAGNYDSYCSASPIIGSCPLPRDRAFTNLGGAGGWQPSYVGGGVNNADLDAYWANHHTGTRPAGLDTRYKIYRAEVDANATGTQPAEFTAGSDGKEPHLPACAKSTVGTESRRLITVAIVDCNYWGVNGASSDLPITSLVAQFFMTEPATSGITGANPSDRGNIYGELVATYKVNDQNGAVYQIVQLVK